MFNDFKKLIHSQLDFLVENSVTLFEVSIDKEELWNLYLDAFPEGTNEIFRERRAYDCSCCRQFIKNYGVIVGIIDGEITSIWDVKVAEPYQTVTNVLNETIKSLPIENVFYSKFKKLGTDYNFELTRGYNKRWEHFYYELPSALVNTSSLSIENLQGSIRQTKEVIKRSFNELNPSAIDTVLELIEGNELYRGAEHNAILTDFKAIQRKFITAKNKDNYCWKVAVKNGRTAAIRNSAIGTLLINLSNQMDLEIAIRKYESVVAPANYKRPKAVYTTSMRQAAEQKVIELGLADSLTRRYAKLEDIKLKNVIWASGESKKVMQSPFDMLTSGDKITANFDYVAEVGIEYFIENMLPNAEKLELLVDNSHINNFVSLIAPQNSASPSLFKWNNGFGWNYNGNFTDSIKESVKARGGKVDGDLRFSLSWAEGDNGDNSDLDAHCKTPNYHIYYSNKNDGNGGQLDVDIQNPNNQSNRNIVENITWESRSRMPVGEYDFSVHNYALRGSQKGFTAEIEFEDQIFNFEYDKPLRNGEYVQVATVYFDGKTFKVTKSLPSTKSSKEVWGVSTMKFIPVTTLMRSPNFWNNQSLGNKHYFFMLENCVNQGVARGFFNEFLRNDLTEHKRIFEALGQKMKVEHTDNQLSGVGFSSTMKNSVLIKLDNRPLKINFTNEQLIINSTKKKVSFSNA